MGLVLLDQRTLFATLSRAAEEPLKSDLDVAGLKAQVLGRIEELEEREREELLSELVPAMETRRYGAGALKTVMGD